jgi:membrane protease YdiL (CAAX protease family)
MPVASEDRTLANTTVKLPTLAPWVHTVFLLTILVLWAAYGVLQPNWTAIPLVLRYISSINMQFLVVGSTIAGLYHRRRFIRSVLGYWSLGGLGRDFGIGILVYICGRRIVLPVIGFAIRFTPLHSMYRREVVQGMMPQSTSQIVLWIVVAITAGFCEEFVFRGYLQQQLASWFRSVPISVGVTALIFGCIHFYQGTGAVVQIACLGVLYGIVAARRGNLRSAMVAHALQDVSVALFYYLKHSR